MSQTIKRAEAGKLKFLVEAVPKLIKIPEELTVDLITKAVERRYGQKLPLRQAQRVKRALGAKPKGPCRECRQMGHSKKTCPRRFEPAPDANGALPNDVPNYESNGLEIDFHDGGESRIEHPHGHCFHPEHNCNCGIDPHISINGGRSSNDSRPHYLDGHANAISIDPSLANDIRATGVDSLPLNPMERSAPAPNGQPGPCQREPPNLSQQDSRAEAARLMQQAAQLMQEAAQLNLEAARLTASSVNH